MGVLDMYIPTEAELRMLPYRFKPCKECGRGSLLESARLGDRWELLDKPPCSKCGRPYIRGLVPLGADRVVTV